LTSSFETNYRKRSFEKFKNESHPIKFVLEVIESFKVPFCVASRGAENKIRLHLELTGLLPYF
jgi:beta-phosphoglucomutase-like phosphatase (HAD superfamily)